MRPSRPRPAVGSWRLLALSNYRKSGDCQSVGNMQNYVYMSTYRGLSQVENRTSQEVMMGVFEQRPIMAFGVPDDGCLDLAEDTEGGARGCRMRLTAIWPSSGMKTSNGLKLITPDKYNRGILGLFPRSSFCFVWAFAKLPVL